MENTLSNINGANMQINKIIERIIRRIFPAGAVNIRLNYQAFNPDFKPENSASAQNNNSAQNKLAEFDYDKLSLNYHADKPHYSFDQIALPGDTVDQIMEAIATIQLEGKVFDEWGLRNIIPYASSAMNFFGPPGTGKSMAAEAVAKYLDTGIIRAAYADIESKYHGEGPRMVKAIFKAAERENAVLFLDEADSLLSKRLTNVHDGSDQAINSMRSQLLISIERFKGIVIFATNLAINYDRAFLSRLSNIEFHMPDAAARKVIWQQHISGNGIKLPLSDDIDIIELASRYTFSGRQIKNAVKDACIRAAMRGDNVVISQEDFTRSCEKIQNQSDSIQKAADHTQNASVITRQQEDALKGILQKKLNEQN
ncbi:MAG: ATP-binding protein [Synergistaceae bacterium]|nr:ATP-binding protein [Synergistaceae bacterium]